MGLEGLWADQGIWEERKWLCGNVNFPWIFLVASGGVGRRGQVGLESQGNSNTLGLGWESGKVRKDSWKCDPKTSWKWIRELLVPCTTGKYRCCGQLERITIELHAPS